MRLTHALCTLLLMLSAGAATAGGTMTPASPQPDEAALKKGLFVEYVYPPDVRTLREAGEWMAGKQRGPDLVGFDYPDTELGENALTSNQDERVVAHIKGYIRLDKAGEYNMDFQTNDGLHVTIGGQVVGHFDGRQTCNNTGVETVTAPSPGWYEVKALYFQRLNTSCLLMEWQPPGSGGYSWTPNDIFAYLD